MFIQYWKHIQNISCELRVIVFGNSITMIMNNCKFSISRLLITYFFHELNQSDYFFRNDQMKAHFIEKRINR